jgi:putative chitinase
MSVTDLQRNLLAHGYDPKGADGLLGANTYQAMAGFLTGGKAPATVGTLLALHLRPGGIDSRLRLIHFFAQVAHESGFKPVQESLNYRADALRALFSKKRISDADCALYGRTAAHPANQEAIANTIYGGAWGAANLGNTEPGDGYRYRGRGLIQLTGRANYRRTGPEYEVNPELVLVPAGSVKAAVDFWRTRGINPRADADDLVGVTRLVNGGTNGLDDRRALADRLKAIWPA